MRDIALINGPLKVVSFLRDPVDRVVSLLDFWRSVRDDEVEKNDLYGPRYLKNVSVTEFLAGDSALKRYSFWNFYAVAFAGHPIFSPNGDVWRSDDELLDCAMKSMEGLAFVGITEDLGTSMSEMCNLLDIRNYFNDQSLNVTRTNHLADPDKFQSTPPLTIGDEMLSLIENITFLDKALYKHACLRLFGKEHPDRVLRCIPGPVHICRTRLGFRDDWVQSYGAGFMLYGPYTRLVPGYYKVEFRLRRQFGAVNQADEAPIASLDVVAGLGTSVIGQRYVYSGSFLDGDTVQELDFQVVRTLSDVEFRVYVASNAAIEADLNVRVRRVR